MPAPHRLTSALRDAQAADRAIRRRAALEAVPVEGGLAVRHPELHDVHFLNAILLGAGTRQLDGSGAAALAERWLGDLGHRHVVFDDAQAGERAAAELQEGGWSRGRILLMALAADPADAVRDGRARIISEEEMDALQIAAVREQAPQVDVRRGLADRLIATQRRLRATTPARCFGAADDRGAQPVSACTLFLDPDVDGRRVATISDVGTRIAHRKRGLARAVVRAAVGHAGRWRAQLIVVGADADDWPQVMYARLGFAELGRQVTLTRRAGAAPDATAGWR